MREKKAGIYKIINKENEKFYLGSSQNLLKRQKQHFSRLLNGKHENLHLQRAFDKYGIDKFEFITIEECPPEICFEREQFYLDLLMPWDTQIGYNIGKGASGGDNYSKHPNKESLRIKLIGHLEKMRSEMTEEDRQKYSDDISGSGNPNWRGGSTKTKCKKCGKEIWAKNIQCRNCYDKVGETNPFFGKTHSEETRKKLAEKSKERGYVGNQERMVMIDGEIYKSCSEAARNLKVCVGTVLHRIKSKNKKYENYHYVI